MHGVRGAVALCFVGMAMPACAYAQVVIDEIMYNPAGSDTGREWVELCNKGASDIALVGGTVKGSWRISDSSNHTLTDPSGGVGRGSLTVPSGGYLVISNDPSTFLAEYTSGSYSVVKSSISLSNTGASVSLIDGNSATVSSVSYTKDQGGYDDGSSLQLQADGTWIAGVPTPGVANTASAYAAPSSSDSAAQSTSQSSGSQTTSHASQAAVPSYVAPPVPSIFANGGADRTVIVGADSEFDARAYDKNSQAISGNVRFSWNFGDGATAEGPIVLHHFSYPGKYAVFLSIAQDLSAGSDEIIVTAEPAALSFTQLPDGGVSIENRAGHDLDLSGWVVKESASAFAPLFQLPMHSLILSGSAMRISSETLKFKAGATSMLEYPNGSLAYAMGQESAPVVSTPAPKPQASEPTRIVSAPRAPAFQRSSAPAPLDSADAIAEPSNTIATSSQVAAAAESASSAGYLWWLGAIALAGVAASGVVAAKRFRKGEWEIIEETRD